MRLSRAVIKRLYARDLTAFKAAGLSPPVVRTFDLDTNELITGPPPEIRSYGDFRDYQRWMTNTIVRKKAVFLAAEMGLGKTAATLKAIRMLLDVGAVTRVLVVAPLKVADLTWPEEIATWSFARDLTFTVLTGDEEDRLIAARQNVEIHIINWENLVWLQKHWGRRWPYDMLVYDEASRLSEARKKTKGNVRKDGTKSPPRLSGFGALRRMRFSFKKVVLLSGTPATGGLVDLWGPIFICDLGKRLGTSKTAYLRRWFHKDITGFRDEPHDHSYDEIMERIDDIFFSLKEKDYLSLPPLVPVDHWITLPPKAMDIYKRMARDMVLEEFDLEAQNSGILTNKLLQIANGSIYRDDKTAERIHEAKLNELESIVREAMGQPILLGYQFKFDVIAIRKRFPFARIFGEHKSDKRDWDAGRIKLLVTHPASAGHGLNLQLGGNIQVWYGLTWSLELYLQFIKRLQRSGQMADRVFLHRILARKTVDEKMVQTLRRNAVTQDMITDAVKASVREIQHEYV